MIAIALIEAISPSRSRLAEHAPADFIIDIQPDQLAGFENCARATLRQL
jgi:predicted lysophospholipase L1 biosynthesis ABC-type transport system permease subunit